MSQNTTELVNLSQKLLVACDQSYAGEQLVIGESALFRYDDAPLYGQFQPPYESSFPQYEVVFVREDRATGFKTVIYRNAGTREIIVAMGGTDGTDLKDWWGNLTHYGWNQWGKNRIAVLQALDGLIPELSGPNGETPKIHFTGQSLGGALAQYAAYEFVETHREYERADLSLVTFNGLGGLAALREELPKRIAGEPIPTYPQIANTPFDASLIAGFGQVAHYGSLNDLIWRAGSGHLGGNVYSFSGLNFASIDPETGHPFLLDTISAHRIETGFYYPLTAFDHSGISPFEESVSNGPLPLAQLNGSYLRIENLQKVASILGNVFRQSETSSSGAMLKLLFGGMGGFTLGDSEQVNHLVREYVETRKRAGKYLGNEEEYEAARDTNWSFRVRIAAAALGAFAVPGPFGLIMKVAGAIALAPFYRLIEGINNDSGEFVLRTAFEMERQGAAVPDATYEESLARSSMIGAPLGITDPDGGELPLTTVAELARDDVEGFAEAMVSEADWHYATSEYLIERAAALGMHDKAQAALNEFWSYSRHAVEGNPTLIASVADQFKRFTTDWAGAVANLNSDLIAPRDTPVQLDGPPRYAQKRTIWNSVLAGLESVLDLFVGTAHAAEAHVAVVGAIDEVRSSAETVVLRPGREPNPFDAPSFDPDATPLALGQLKEGSVQTFTAYLPYEAALGGQKIKFMLAGAAADKLAVWDEEIELSTDGTFTLTVAEGQRELTFQIAALEDVDADETFTLSAQLVAVVDGNEVATHLEHDELELALDAQDEALPAGGMELHGDWGLKLYPTTNPDGTLMVDENGNQVFHTRFDLRYPPFTNLERDPNGRPDLGETGPLTGIDGADHIWLGEYGGSGWAIGMGGDDYFEGMVNVPNFIIGDDAQNFQTGNDTIEGGENLEPYSDPGFIREGERIEGIGDDILFGGPGDDHIYADRIALLEQTLDPDTPALDQKGDWITGEQGDDRIFGSAAHDALFGGGGADEIHAGAGNDVVDGDDSYENWGDAWWEVDPGFFGVTFFPVTNVRSQFSFEYYKDEGGDDVLDGGAGDDLIFGMLGDDTLIGGSGKDRLEGWEGDDQLFGGSEDDVLAGDFGRYEVPWFRMPGANLRVMPGAVGLFFGDASVVDQVGNDFLDGGAGNDHLYGEAGDDTLLGGGDADVLFGDAAYLPEDLHGHDVLDGGAGADSLAGNAGDDRLFGGMDNDWLSGGAGNDQADGGSGDDNVSGGEGNDILEGGDGVDILAGDAGSDVLDGGGGNDRLAGGQGDDVLLGSAGADSLDGGAGVDRLYGGSGDDVLSGGEGNDLADGGPGSDLVRGGAGDDTYVFNLGYGQDLIEDNEGNNRLAFGAGIAPDDLSATLDGATLSATIAFGGARDAATLDMSAFQVGGVDFASGTSWGRKEFLSFMPALVSVGSEADEVLAGNEKLRNELHGFGGDDHVIGSANDDLLDGGAGADGLDGGGGSDLYVFAASDGGIDALADSELQARAYLDWYYGNLGISQWLERGQHRGKYKALLAVWGFSFSQYYDSFDEAFADFPFADISLVEPLPSVAPLVRRDDDAALDELVAAGVLSRDIVEFGSELALSDLTLSVTVNAAEAAEHPEQPWYSGGTLSVRWADAGFELDVPGVNYGFVGSNLLTDGSDPQSDAPGAWRGYRLGEGVEAFRFADSTTYSLEEVLAQAVVVEIVSDYQFSRDSGTQLISRNYPSIAFDPDIRSSEVSVSRDGTDLLITVSAGGAQGRIEGWYDNPDSVPSLSLKFAADPQIDAETLTELGLRMAGTDGDDVIAGLDGFDDVLSGASGSDMLDGGTGQDTYVFNRGDGVDTISEVPAGAGDPEASIIVFGPDIFDSQLEFGLGSLVVEYGEGDAIHFTGFNAADPYATPVFQRLEFNDGSVMVYDELLAELQFQHYGTEGDDVITGTDIGDVIDGGVGNDTLVGVGGADNLEGSEGDDTLAGGMGDGDAMAGQEGSDTYIYAAGDGYDSVFEWSETPGEIDSLLLTGGIAPADVRVTRDEWSYHLFFGGPDRLVLDSMAVEPAAEIERIEFEDGTVWTASDLAARLELVPGTDLDDALWGTPENDVMEGFAGYDLLYGHGGDDLLTGGEGDDYYFFAAGDGADRIDNFDPNPDSWDWIRLVDAVSGEASLTKSGNDLVLHLGNGDDRVTLIDWYADERRKIDVITFEGDGVYWDAAMLEQLAPAGGNSAPELSNPIADQTTDEDSVFAFTVPGDTFSDVDAGDTLSYDASLADGSALPGWLSFDPDSRTFSGTPDNADVGLFDVTVTTTDASGESASDAFHIEVLNTNDAPVTADDAADIEEDASPTVAGDVLANDTDVDAGASLAVAAPGTLVGGYGSLELRADGGYRYSLDNAAVHFLRGGAAVADVFEYAASDGVANTAGLLTVTIRGVNDAPVANDDAAHVEEDGAPASGGVLANDIDVDAETVLSITNPGTYAGAYGTLTLDADGTFAYALDTAAVQSLGSGQSAMDVFAYVVADNDATPLTDSGRLIVSIAGINDVPIVVEAIPDQIGREGHPFDFRVPSGTFFDVDGGDTLMLSASLAEGAPLPGWLVFENGVFHGTAGAADGGEYRIQVTAIDSAGASAAASFGLAVTDSFAVGNHLIGTRRDDVLNGTGSAELLDGRGGADRLLAGGGDDVLQFFADDRVKGKNRTHDFFDGGSGFDTLLGTDEHDAVLLDDARAGPGLIGVEYIATGDGHDLVDLRTPRFSYTSVILDGGEGHDVLRAAGGSDLLLGGKGNDQLIGGAGQDVYVHELRGGNDEIDEGGIAGEIDVLRFGEGITRDMVHARRQRHDLVLDVSGPHGSVTVKGWFASEAQRIESIEFADGTAWDEKIVRRLVCHRHHDGWHDQEHCANDRRDGRRDGGLQERADRRDDRAQHRDEGGAAISQQLAKHSPFDFETLARELDRSSKRDEVLSPQEIARRWAAVHRYTSALALEADEYADQAALIGPRGLTVPALHSGGGFGFEASIGAARGPDSFSSLEGLNEGFRKL